MNQTLQIARQSSPDSDETAIAVPADDLQDLLDLPAINLRLLMENCMEKPLFAVSLLEEFERTATSRLKAFDDRLSQGNLDVVAEMAHGLKGVAAILGATRLEEINLNLELACRKFDVRTDRLSRELHTEMQRVLQVIPSLRVRLRQQHDERA